MPTWPANQTDGEQKVAGERLLLRQVPGGLQIFAPGRDEFIPQPSGWAGGGGSSSTATGARVQ
jgi:hypothetical protein